MMNTYRSRFALLCLAGFILAALHTPGIAADQPKIITENFKEDELALCPTKECRILAVHPAGKDENNKAQRVVELDLGDTEDEWSCRNGHKQYWLLGDSKKTLLLLDLCNNGYGASGVGEDEVTIGDNTLTHNQNGGSADRWYTSTTVRLSPPALLSKKESGYSVFRPNSSLTEHHTDWQTLKSTYTNTLPPCDENGEPPEENADGEPSDDNLQVASTTISLIPRFAQRSELPKNADSAILGSCALETNVDNGFALKGKPNRDHWIKSLIVGNELWISIGIDELRAKGKNWINDDHLELWLAESEDYESSHCIRQKPNKEGLRQWGIGLVDGKIYPGFGVDPHEKPPITLLARTQLRDPNMPQPIDTLRIALPENHQKLTLVLVRGDGNKQVSLLASSKLQYGKTVTLGHFFDIPSDSIECAVVDGRLNLIRSNVPLPPVEDE